LNNSKASTLREQAAANTSPATSTESENKPSTVAPMQNLNPSQTSKEKHAMPATVATHAKAALRARKLARPSGTGAKSKLNTASARRSSPVAASPEEAASESSFERHSRKCKICSHPDREIIEELFINWHSAQSIRGQFAMYHPFDWWAVYRHARAAGLYAKRRKNLRAVLDLLLEGVTNVSPTAHGVIAAVRAYSCLTETNSWVEPEKRVRITNHVYRHDSPARPDEGSVVADAPAASTTSSPERSIESVSATAASEPLSTYRSSTGTATPCPAGTISSTEHQNGARSAPSASPASNFEPPASRTNRQTSKLESPPTRT
jgi:hypothetical protein